MRPFIVIRQRKLSEWPRAWRAAAILFPSLLLLCLMSAACGAGRTGEAHPMASVPATVVASKIGQDPNEVSPAVAAGIDLSQAELDRIRAMHAKAGIVLHYGGNDWSNAQLAGLKAQFGRMGIEVVLVTDAGFRPEKQIADVETVLALKPDVVVAIPTDPIATAGIYRKLADRRIKLVFMDDVPRGLVAGRDYVGMVSADNYGNGAAAATLMAHALGGRGNIGIIFHAADFSPTRKRYDGFKATLAASFPDVRIVDEQGIGGPDFSTDAERAAGAMMLSHRDLNGIWAVWDVPAEGVIAAARTLGRVKLVITTCDLGENVAIDLARGDYVRGVAAQRPFDQGIVEAILAGYGLLNKKAPGYVVVPVMPVTRDNVVDAWRKVYHTDVPAAILNSLNDGRFAQSPR
jgi:ribose transport system substrate-binding protein